MTPFYWTGYANANRNATISAIEKAVAEYGYITDFKMFSDISISVFIDIEEQKIDLLHVALKNFMGINEFQPLTSNSTKERKIFLNVTFGKGTGDLKIEVPAVPG